MLYILLLLAVAGLGLAASLTLFGNGDGSGKTASTGRALVGGPFQLVNQLGETVTEATYKGRYTLVYFGYTFCPDVCPEGLQTIGSALDIFEEKGGKLDRIVPIFVTVDPERDTPEIMKEYVSNFHPSLQGLSGTVAQMSDAAKAYRIYWAKVKDPDSSAEYLMDHTSLTYLMGPDGEYLSHFSHNISVEKMAERLIAVVH